MITHIRGTVIGVQENSITVQTGALAFQLYVAYPLDFISGNECQLFIHMLWSQELGPTLYGFSKQIDKTVFLLIISCSGIGPKIGLSIISNLGAIPFIHAVSSQDHALLSKVPGIGLKKAEQLVVQVKSKAVKLLTTGELGDNNCSISKVADVAQALSSLNYTPAEVTHAVRYLSSTYQEKALPFDQLMRHALSFLAKKT